MLKDIWVFAEKVHNSFAEGMCTLEDQELDEIIEQ